MEIINRDRYPQSEFVSESDIKPYVEVDGQIYLLVGYEDGDRDTPLVARNEPRLHATPLYELLKFTQGSVNYLGQERE